LDVAEPEKKRFGEEKRRLWVQATHLFSEVRDSSHDLRRPEAVAAVAAAQVLHLRLPGRALGHGDAGAALHEGVAVGVHLGAAGGNAALRLLRRIRCGSVGRGGSDHVVAHAAENLVSGSPGTTAQGGNPPAGLRGLAEGSVRDAPRDRTACASDLLERVRSVLSLLRLPARPPACHLVVSSFQGGRRRVSLHSPSPLSPSVSTPSHASVRFCDLKTRPGHLPRRGARPVGAGSRLAHLGLGVHGPLVEGLVIAWPLRI